MIRRHAMKGCLLAALALFTFAMPAAAQDVLIGLDLWTTRAGAAANFSDNPIAPGFFPCGAGFNGSIPLVGKPIAANKSLGGADTIIGRLNDVPGGTGWAQAIILALSLENKNWVGPCGNTWHVKVRLAGNQQFSWVQMTRSGPGGGTFNSWVNVNAEVIFMYPNGGGTYGSVLDPILLTSTGSCWAYTPGPGGITVSGPVTFDTDCDGVPDFNSPVGTSNFHAGWGPGGVYCPINHDGPHPVGAPKPRPCNPQQPVPHFPQTGEQLPDLETGDRGVIVEPAPTPTPEPEPVPCEDTPVIVTQN